MNGISARLAAASGAFFVVAALVGNAMFSSGSVEGTDGASALADLQRDRSLVNDIGFVLEILAFAAFLVFLGYLYKVLRRAEGADGSAAAVALGGGLVYLAIKVGSAGPLMAGFYRSDELTPDLARTLVDLNDMAFVVSGFVFGLFCAAAAVSTMARGVVPRWLGWAGLVIGLLTAAVGTIGIVQVRSFNPLPFVAALAWTLVVSVVLTVRLWRPSAQPALPVPSPSRLGLAGPE